MKKKHISFRLLILVKLVAGGAICLLLAAHDANGLSVRDLAVGGATVIGSTLTVQIAIEEGTALLFCGHTAAVLLLLDAATGFWLNASPLLDKIVR